MRRLHVFICEGAADGRLVHTDDVGNLGHCQRLQFGDAHFEEFHLVLDDFPGDALDRILALFDRVDDEFSGAEFFAQVVALLLAEFAFGDEILVGVAQAKARNVILVQDDFPFRSIFFDRDISDDDAVGVVGESPTGGGIEGANLLDSLLDNFVG